MKNLMNKFYAELKLQYEDNIHWNGRKSLTYGISNYCTPDGRSYSTTDASEFILSLIDVYKIPKWFIRKHIRFIIRRCSNISYNSWHYWVHSDYEQDDIQHLGVRRTERPQKREGIDGILISYKRVYYSCKGIRMLWERVNTRYHSIKRTKCSICRKIAVAYHKHTIHHITQYSSSGNILCQHCIQKIIDTKKAIEQASIVEDNLSVLKEYNTSIELIKNHNKTYLFISDICRYVHRTRVTVCSWEKKYDYFPNRLIIDDKIAFNKNDFIAFFIQKEQKRINNARMFRTI